MERELKFSRIFSSHEEKGIYLAFQQIIRKALRRNPGERYQNAGEMYDAIVHWKKNLAVLEIETAQEGLAILVDDAEVDASPGATAPLYFSDSGNHQIEAAKGSEYEKFTRGVNIRVGNVEQVKVMCELRKEFQPTVGEGVSIEPGEHFGESSSKRIMRQFSELLNRKLSGKESLSFLDFIFAAVFSVIAFIVCLIYSHYICVRDWGGHWPENILYLYKLPGWLVQFYIPWQIIAVSFGINFIPIKVNLRWRKIKFLVFFILSIMSFMFCVKTEIIGKVGFFFLADDGQKIYKNEVLDSLVSGGVEANKSKNWSNTQGMLLVWPTKKDKKYSDQYEVGARLMAALGMPMIFDNNADIKAAIDHVVMVSYKDGVEAEREIVKGKIKAILSMGSEPEKKEAEVQQPIPITEVEVKVNSLPQIISEPLTEVLLGQDYSYSLIAIDIENNLLSYSIKKGPNGMTIDPLTGTIHWLPLPSDLGKHDVIVSVSDGTGKTIKSFSVMVKEPVNQKPVINSNPPTTAVTGETYTYMVKAIDPNNDTLIYSLEQSPIGMSIEKTTNDNIRISWMPLDTDVGNHKVIVKVSDEGGEEVLQIFTIKVSLKKIKYEKVDIIPNPKIGAIPPQTGKVGELYSCTIKTTSRNNFGKLTYSLLEYPSGMTINSSTGEISWTPEESQEGDQNVTVKLVVKHSDGSLLSEDKNTFTINIPHAVPKNDMVFIPAGEFWMGSQGPESGWKNARKWEESPLIKIYLDDYYIDRYEVTNQEFEEFRVSTNYKSYYDYRKEEGPRSNQPVVNVSWDNANDYCKGKGKRLPTEAEWEKAARGGIYLDGDASKKMENRNPKREYPWGNENPRGRANFGHQNINWGRNYSALLKDVGSYVNGKSPYGLYDMVGNAIEWVADYYEDGFYEKLARQEFVKNPINDSFFTSIAVGNIKVVRGGSIFSSENELGVAKRTSEKQNSGDYEVGFRCAK